MRITVTGDAVQCGIPLKLSLKQKTQLRKLAMYAQELRSAHAGIHQNMMNRQAHLSQLKQKLIRSERAFSSTDFQHMEQPVEKGQYGHRIDYRARAEGELQELRDAISLQQDEFSQIVARSKKTGEDAGALTRLVDSILEHCNLTFENLHMERV